MASAHTRGPFRIRPSRDGSGDVGIEADGVPNVIAECYAALRSADERARAEALANARLFVAAPDLLIQIKGLLALAKFIISAADIDAARTTCVLRNRGEFVADVPIAVVIEHAEAAIAKAEAA